MTSILNRVVRLVNNWKDQTFTSRTNRQEQLNLSENREESSTTSSQSELIDLSVNSPTTQTSDTNHFYYAIGEQRSQMRPESDCVQNLEMNIQDTLTDSSQTNRFNQAISNIRLFRRPSIRRSSNRSRRSNNSAQILLSNRSSRSTETNTTSLSNSPQHNVYELFSMYKKRERNFLSAICAIFCISILSVSLVDTRWFFLQGGGCNLNYVGVAHFFAPGRLEYQIETSKISKNEILVYNFILPNGIGKLKDD